MTKGIFTVLTCAAVCFATSIARAESTTPSDSTLAAMGLSGMQILSDNDALAIRGKGYVHQPKAYPKSHVAVWGSSTANISKWGGDASSDNGYKATGQHFAKGANESYAGVSMMGKDVWKQGCRIKFHGFSKSIKFNAGGSSFAVAH